MNRAAQWEQEWLEYVAGALLVLGFFVAARGAYVGASYLVSFLTGGLLGKFWYDIIRRKQARVHIAVLTLAVLLGLMLGGLTVDTRWLVLLYVLGLVLSYSAHYEKWIRTA